MNRPNILFIFTDQQAISAMSAYGNPHLRTPHMDSIAASGVRFTKSYCTSPVCSPARASLMTGRMPHEVGIDVNEIPIPPDVPTLGELFRDAGYETAYAGKWHLPELYPLGQTSIAGFDYLDIPKVPQHYLGVCADDLVTDAAVAFLRREHARPFLLCVSINNPHDICYWISEYYQDLIEGPLALGAAPPLPANFAISPDEPEFIQACRRRDHYGPEQLWADRWDEAGWRRYLDVYYRLTEHADDRVGRVVAALREAGLEGNTLIVFTSDHGEGVAEHKKVAKLSLYEAAAAVPLVVSWKGHTPTGVVDTTHLVSGLDLVPTLCDYAGIPVPDGLRGQSLKPLIEHPELPGHEYLVAELQPDTKRPEMKARMVRTCRFKYLAFSEGTQREALFNLDADPLEQHDLARDPQFCDVLAHHRALLRTWIAETRDSFTEAP